MPTPEASGAVGRARCTSQKPAAAAWLGGVCPPAPAASATVKGSWSVRARPGMQRGGPNASLCSGTTPMHALPRGTPRPMAGRWELPPAAYNSGASSQQFDQHSQLLQCRPQQPCGNSPAIRQPSTSLCGSWRMISRSLHVPGSDSSPFTTRYEGRPSDTCGKHSRRRACIVARGGQASRQAGEALVGRRTRPLAGQRPAEASSAADSVLPDASRLAVPLSAPEA